MHNKILEWQDHPLTKALVKVLSENKEAAVDQAYIATTDIERAKLIARAIVCKEILDFETLFLGELDKEE